MTNDTNITEGFIAMVEAYKAKPELEATITKLKEDLEYFGRHLSDEQYITSTLRNRIEVLENQLAEVKTQRDDAMFRNLELEELKDKIGTLAGQLLGSLKQSDPQPSQAVTVTEPERLPEAAGPIMSGPEPTPYVPTWDAVEPPHSEPMSGYPGPIDPVVVEPQPDTAPLPSLNPSEPDGWERGKPYSYKPWYMTDAEWIGRGGFGPAKDVVEVNNDCIF